MFGLSKSHAHAIGIDISQEGVRIVQLAEQAPRPILTASSWFEAPGEAAAKSDNWHQWVSAGLHKAIAGGPYRGKAAVTALRPGEIMVETLRIPRADSDQKIEQALVGRLRSSTGQKITRQTAIVRYIRFEQDSALVMVADKQTVDRYLGILEAAGLDARAIVPWPQALTSCYAKFFGRRQSDLQAVVMLIYFEPTQTHVVICRHSMPLLARSISLGTSHLGDGACLERLAAEILGCRQQLSEYLYGNPVSRVIFLSGQTVDKQICTEIAKQLQVQAQVADCLAAVDVPGSVARRLDACGLDRRASGADGWAMAFGLSLSG